MRLAIIGGLGYLGSVIADVELNTRKDKENVLIVDNCIYNNEDVAGEIRGVKDLNFKNFIKGDIIEDLIIKQVLDWNPDVIIWTCNYDIRMFYEEHSSYSRKMLNAIEQLSKNTQVLNLSSYDTAVENDSYFRYFSEIEKISSESIRVPVLYGPSLRMRWDTLVNMMFYNLLIEKQISLIKYWLDVIPVAHVWDYARFILNQICGTYDFNKTDIVCSDHYSLIEIANLVKIPLQKKQHDCEIIVNDFEVKDLERVEDGIEGIKNGPNTSIVETFDFIISQIEANKLADFTSERYNNTAIVQSATMVKNFVNLIK